MSTGRLKRPWSLGPQSEDGDYVLIEDAAGEEVVWANIAHAGALVCAVNYTDALVEVVQVLILALETVGPNHRHPRNQDVIGQAREIVKMVEGK